MTFDVLIHDPADPDFQARRLAMRSFRSGPTIPASCQVDRPAAVAVAVADR
jgi:hypothetical protein